MLKEDLILIILTSLFITAFYWQNSYLIKPYQVLTNERSSPSERLQRYALQLQKLQETQQYNSKHFKNAVLNHNEHFSQDIENQIFELHQAEEERWLITMGRKERNDFENYYRTNHTIEFPTPFKDRLRKLLRTKMEKIENNDRNALLERRKIFLLWQTYLLYQEDSKTTLFNEMIERRQFQVNCKSNDTRYLIYFQHQDNGLGAELHTMQLALTAAFITNRTFIISEDLPWHWKPEDCKAGTWTCYFEPVSNCPNPLHEFGNSNLRWSPREHFHLMYTQDIWKRNDDRIVLWGDYWDPNFWYTVPQEFSKKGLFWWRSQLSSWLFRLNKVTWNKVNNAISNQVNVWGMNISNMGGVHVRRGDKVFGSSYNNPEMEYFSSHRIIHTLLVANESFSKMSGIYISTRDLEVITSLESISRSYMLNITFFSDKEKARESGFNTFDLISKQMNPEEEAIATMRDIILLTRTKLFLGMMDSNLSRLVFELGAAWRANQNSTNWLVIAFNHWTVDP